MKNIFLQNKKIIPLILTLAVVFLIFPTVCQAQAKTLLDLTIGNIAMMIANACGEILGRVVALVIDFAQYDNYVRNTQVIDAWKIVRDLR